MNVARLALVVLAFAATVAPVAAQDPRRDALDGIDPVILLTQGKEISGKSEFKISRGRFDYLFASAENKAAFEKTPEKYEIQLGGLCAKMGGGAMGNPADFAVVDGKIYVFGSDDCHKKFVAAPAKYLPKPVPVMPSAAADLQRGRTLIDKAVAAIGGAARLDAVTTYVESASQTVQRPQGEAIISTRTMWRLPDDVRNERTMTLAGRTNTTANLVTKQGAWFLTQGRGFAQSPEAIPTAQQEYGRRLVPLLHARTAAGFTAAALAAATIDGTEVDRVRVRNGAIDVTLNLTRTNAAIHSLTFTGRNQDSEIGEYTIVYGDFRDVTGLKLPFAERALFNGAPDAFLTRKIAALAINAPLEASLFDPPAGGGGK